MAKNGLMFSALALAGAVIYLRRRAGAAQTTPATTPATPDIFELPPAWHAPQVWPTPSTPPAPAISPLLANIDLRDPGAWQVLNLSGIDLRTGSSLDIYRWLAEKGYTTGADVAVSVGDVVQGSPFGLYRPVTYSSISTGQPLPYRLALTY